MIRLKIYYTLITLLFLIVNSKILSAQEVQIALDLDNKIYNIDDKLEKKLQLFNTYKGFKNAVLFQISDSSFVLETSYEPEKVILRERKPLNNEELFAFRTKVSNNIKRYAPESAINQEGLSNFLINNAVISLTYYGIAVPLMVEAEDGKTALSLYMLTAGSSFFIPYALTKNKQVTKADATLSFYGQTRGALHGGIIPLLFTNNPSQKGVAASSMGLSILEGTAGFLWSDKQKMSHGKATTLGVFSDFGMGIGLATTHISGLYETGNSETIARSLATGILSGSILGFTAGNILTKNTNYSRGDALALRTSGFLGASITTTILFASDKNSEVSGKYYSLSAAIGSISGLTYGHFLAKKNDFTPTQGVLIQLGTLAGGALGAGISYLSTDEDRVIVTAVTVGALLGYGLLTSSFAQRKSLKKNDKVSFNFSLNHGALLTFTKQKSTVKSPPTFFNASLTF